MDLLKTRWFILGILSIIFVSVVIFCSRQAPMIPRAVIFGNPEKTNPKISPDGKRMAYLAPHNNVLNVFVKTIGLNDDQVITQDTLRGIRIYFWAEDNEHLIYLQDAGGNENWQIFVTHPVSRETRLMTPDANVQARIIATDKKIPDHILIALNKRDPRVHDAYRLNIKTGEMVLEAENPGNVAGWVTDDQMKVRGFWGALPDGGFELRIRADEKAPWNLAGTWGPDDNLSGPLTFTKDGKSVYLLDSRNANALRLVKLNLESGQIEVIAEDPQYDVSNVVLHPDTYEIQAVEFAKDRVEWRILDSAIQADFDKIKAIETGDLFFTGRDQSDKNWVFGFTKDDGPVPFYAFDRETQKVTFLFHSRPALKKYALAKMQPISFQARDGMTIHGYLTLPAGSSGKNLPLVLNVHGGPWARDNWGYHPEAQWLANRGYACLQINFRGSTGYGKEFVNAGNREWGAKMQDDLTDAVKWAVREGIADSNKVAIYGGSYGGYAALAGAAFTPELYTCAISVVGPSNIVTLIQSIPPYWSTLRKMFDVRVGNIDAEAEFLKSRSPLFFADRIQIPMLIAQGANDPRVKQAESEQIVRALRANNHPVQYLLFPDEGHGFARPENRIKFYAAAEKFLADYLGGRYEPYAGELPFVTSLDENPAPTN